MSLKVSHSHRFFFWSSRCLNFFFCIERHLTKTKLTISHVKKVFGKFSVAAQFKKVYLIRCPPFDDPRATDRVLFRFFLPTCCINSFELKLLETSPYFTQRIFGQSVGSVQRTTWRLLSPVAAQCAFRGGRPR